MGGVPVAGHSPQDSQRTAAPRRKWSATDIGGNSWPELAPARNDLHRRRRQRTCVESTPTVARPVEFTKPDSNGEVDLHSPFPLPDGRNMLVGGALLRTTGFRSPCSLSTATRRKTIVESGFAPTYLPSGHLVFGRGSTILAAPFDATRLEVTGPAVALVERVDNEPPSGIIDYRLSSSGALAYIPQRSSSRRTLTWMTLGRESHADRRFLPARLTHRASRRTALRSRTCCDQEDGRRQIWIHEFASGRRVQMTRDGDHWAPVWTRDGHGLMYGKATASGSEVVTPPAQRRSGDPRPKPEPIVSLPRSRPIRRRCSSPSRRQPTTHFISQLDMRRPGTIAKLPLTGGDPSQREPVARWPMGRVRRSFRRTSSRFLSKASRPPEHRARSASREAADPIWSRDGRTLFFRSVSRVSSCPPCRSTRHAGSPGRRRACSSRRTSSRTFARLRCRARWSARDDRE